MCSRPGGPSRKPTSGRTTTLPSVPGVPHCARHSAGLREVTERKLLGDGPKQGQTRLSAGPRASETTRQSLPLVWGVSTFAEPN